MTKHLADATALVVREARLLDLRRYEEWRALYTEDARYWVPVDPDAADPENGLNIVYDDHERTLDRLFRLSSGNAHVEEPPSRTRRLVGGTEVSECEHGADLEATSTFILVTARLGRQRTLAGDYAHCLRADGERLLIARKRVGLMDALAAHDPLAFLL
jgi:benzoate/toluate 1,2-dioxygenase beta subunit